ncbi:hypothetical protein [Gordonia humi]|uniref:Uncharacterized protein n=1 Tax=Gordonia humi TaxID=686429 RepID=A0A840F045_9ACTN|nr:hypothetical protein [Gordonia humi]MBB4135984.1 hypothetical protein [Gordonia humi]
MGLMLWWRTKRMKDPVLGKFTVDVCPTPASGGGDIPSISYSALILGVVSAPDVPPKKVRHHCSVPVKKYPKSGQNLPVIVDRADPTRLAIRWDEVSKRPKPFADYA